MQIHFRYLHSRKTTAFWFDWVLPTGKPPPSSMMITVVLGEAGNFTDTSLGGVDFGRRLGFLRGHFGPSAHFGCRCSKTEPLTLGLPY